MAGRGRMSRGERLAFGSERIWKTGSSLGFRRPNTYLFVGKFYDKNDALHFKYKIRDLFPNTMVIKKPIDPPVLKD
mgnify:CR=1 FL=1